MDQEDDNQVAQWGHFWLVHTSTVELLLNNADALHLDMLTSKNNDGKTGFQQAQHRNKTAVVELIKAKRPSIAVQISYVMYITMKYSDKKLMYKSTHLSHFDILVVIQVPGA